MNNHENDTGIIDRLKQCNDDELRTVIAEAQQLLKQRDGLRKKQALEQIQTIAKAHGLSINVANQTRRGRPPKKAAE